MKQKTLKDWIIATKPWSFNVSVSSVVVTGIYLYYHNLHSWHGAFSWTNLLLAVIMIVLFHAAGNLLSDFRDFIYGVDKSGNDNEVKWISGGLFKPSEIRNYGYVLLAVATLVGVVILQRTSWEVAWIGVLAIILAGAYSWFKFHAMGDLDIILTYAILPSLGTSFVVTGAYHYEVILLSLTYGLFTCGLLHYNNTRDIESDSEAGIVTMPILVGRKASKIIYLLFEMVPFVLTLVLVAMGWLPWPTLLVFLSFLSAYKLVKIMLHSRCAQDLAGLDQPNAQQQLLFSLLMTAGICLGLFI